MRTTMGLFRAAALLVGLLLPLTLSAPVEEKVLTPAGYRLKSSVHEVPAGGRVAHVGEEIHLIGADGTILHVAHKGDAEAVRKVLPGEDSPAASGWVAFAYWVNLVNRVSLISSFTTSWEVPPTPVTDHGQTVFLFNSLEPLGQNAILQPVLQVSSVLLTHVFANNLFYFSGVPLQVRHVIYSCLKNER